MKQRNKSKTNIRVTNQQVKNNGLDIIKMKKATAKQALNCESRFILPLLISISVTQNIGNIDIIYCSAFWPIHIFHYAPQRSQGWFTWLVGV